MKVEVLECFLYGIHIGRFERRNYTTGVTFVYDEDTNQLLSLSIPRDTAPKPRAARNYLANLLPESPGAREIITAHSGAQADDDFALLEVVGGDVSGAVQLMPEGQSPQEWTAPPIIARENAIAGRIRTIKAAENQAAGLDPGTWPMRFSLAGVQAKFALANVDGEWFWSDTGTPSTHILKPEAKEHAGIQQIETAAMHLANLSGVHAATGELAQFGGQTTFMTERFDRSIDADGIATRIHVEDSVQAYGEEVGFKYHLGAEEIVEMLRQHGAGDAEYQFVRQLAFNIGVKNADAHGKNYSFIHQHDGRVTLSPMYDIVPMGFFPKYSQALSMSVGYEEQLVRLRASHWIEFAKETGLEPDQVLEIVSEVSTGILNHVDAAFSDIDSAHREVTVAEIKRYNERIVSDNA